MKKVMIALVQTIVVGRRESYWHIVIHNISRLNKKQRWKIVN